MLYIINVDNSTNSKKNRGIKMDKIKTKIVVDSSADLSWIHGVDVAIAPLKIITDEYEYVDDRSLNVERMIEELAIYKGRSSTSCPSATDWLDAFGDADRVFCVTITSALSGSYSAACIARDDYLTEHPDRRVYVVDSLSAGPEVRLYIEKLRQLIDKENDFDAICKEMEDYKNETSLFFMLESLTNLANNGRINPSIAKMASMLGIRIVGKASSAGELKMLLKVCGEKKAISAIIERMERSGYKGGKVRISHCLNENGANKLATEIRKRFDDSDIKIYKTSGLCSFYAEKGGILVAFER